MANENDAVSPPDNVHPSVTVTISDPRPIEGSYGGTPFVCTITRDGDTSEQQLIYWHAYGSGEHPISLSELDATIRALVFAPGETTKTFTMWTVADFAVEPDEGFTLSAFDPTTETDYGTPAHGTLVDDDTKIAITVQTPTLREDSVDGQGAEFLFEVQRWGDLSQTDVLPWTVATEYSGFSIGSNFAGGVLPQGVVTFAPGETSKTIAVKVAPDAVTEIDMRFSVEIAGDGRIPFGSSASATILNDDATVELRRISNQVEGNSGTTDYVFELIRTGDASVAHSVTWTVSDSRWTGRFRTLSAHTRPMPPISWVVSSRPAR